MSLMGIAEERLSELQDCINSNLQNGKAKRKSTEKIPELPMTMGQL